MPVEVSYPLETPTPPGPPSWANRMAAADRAVVKHLGGTVLYAAGGGDPVPVQGIFDRAYVRVDAGQAGVSGAGPAVFFLLADLPSDPETDDPTITVEGVSYQVREAEPDGLGGVRLLLHVTD